MRLVVATALGAWLAIAAPSAQSNMARPEKYTAFAVDISNTSPGARTSPVDITISRWSTDAERDQLLSTLRDKGQDALLEALQKLPVVGYINTPGSLKYDLHFALQRPESEGGRMVFLMTDRYIGAWEAVNRPRTIDYPFTLIEMRIGPDSEGEGKMSLFTKVMYDKKRNQIVLENYASQPVLLTKVRRESANTAAR